MSQLGAGPQDAQTVPVRVQVIDLEPFAMDMVVPSYLPARDLTQRVARDAGLGAYWDDGTRKLYWLRARGRLLGDEERLEDLGVVPHELLHLLPQPPKGAEVKERRPEYPPTRGYTAAGTLNALGGLGILLLWTALWSTALTVEQHFLVGMLPALGLALLATSFSRHLVGGLGSSFKVPLLGLLVFLPLVLIAAVPPFFMGTNLTELDLGPRAVALLVAMGPGILIGLFGVLLGWLAWYGAVEPLPKQVVEDAQQSDAVDTVPCAICGGPVTPDVRHDCPYGCGRAFHVGCWNARVSVHQGESCAVCGWTPGQPQA